MNKQCPCILCGEPTGDPDWPCEPCVAEALEPEEPLYDSYDDWLEVQRLIHGIDAIGRILSGEGNK